VLTASVLFPAITAGQIVAIFAACGAVSVVACAWVLIRRRAAASAGGAASVGTAGDAALRNTWRMPPLAELGGPVVSRARKLGLTALRGYLAIAMIMVILKIVLMATAH